MKIQWKKLILCIVIPLAVGGLSALLTKDAAQAFTLLNKPPLSPPAWLFPVLWTILYILMGIASYMILVSGKSVSGSLIVYAIQLFFNFSWTLIFFNLTAYLPAFLWLTALWLLILITIFLFRRISAAAALLLVPYILWVTFAGYLNLMIYIRN